MDAVDLRVGLALRGVARGRGRARRGSRCRAGRAARRSPGSRAGTARASRPRGSRSPRRGRCRRSAAGRGACECSRRESDARMPASCARRGWSASGPRCASSSCSCSGRSSQTPARFFEPASVSCSSPPSANRSRNIGVFAPLPAGGMYLRRPALIRCTISTSSPSEVGSRKRLARRSTLSDLPSRADSRGSIVFSVATCAGPAFSTGLARTSGSSACRHASTSGSSGMAKWCLSGRKTGVFRETGPPCASGACLSWSSRRSLSARRPPHAQIRELPGFRWPCARSGSTTGRSTARRARDDRCGADAPEPRESAGHRLVDARDACGDRAARLRRSSARG